MSNPINVDLQKLLSSVEKKEKASKRRIVIFSIIPLLLALSLLYYISLKVQEKREVLTSINQEVALKTQRIKALNDSLFNLGKTALNGFGYSTEQLSTITTQQIQSSLDANTKIIDFIKTHRISPGIDIRYYPKGADQDKIILALKAEGFNPIIIRAREAMQDTPTNAIWYGNGANLDDVKLVAMYLIRAGIALKSIKPFDNPGGPKKNAIEIGAGKMYVAAQPYTIDQVLASNNLQELSSSR